MKILAVSDDEVPALHQHFQRERWPKIDLILSCGDLPGDYLSFLVSVFDARLFYVRGNHDLNYQECPPEGGEDLHGRIVRFGGLRLAGLEGSPWYNGKPLQYREREMRLAYWRLLPRLWWAGGVDLMVCHAPPRGIHDDTDQAHRGFVTFNHLIARFRPRFFIHGHCHLPYCCSDRITVVGQTTVINAYGYHLFDVAPTG